jgi:hypothetical protein
MSKCPPGSVGPYPEDDWDPYFFEKYGKKPVVEPIKFLGVPLTLEDPQSLVNGTDECAVLMAYKNERGLYAQDIFREAQGAYEAVAPVLAAIGLSTDNPVNRELKVVRSQIVQAIEDPIYLFKAKYLRARPWTCCGDNLQPMLIRPHWRYPGQPAYPSGHATVAWVFAYLFGAYATAAQKSKLETAAAQVARNREIAGVHYPSDSEAGRRLARQLVNIVLAQQTSPISDIKAAVQSLHPS